CSAHKTLSAVWPLSLRGTSGEKAGERGNYLRAPPLPVPLLLFRGGRKKTVALKANLLPNTTGQWPALLRLKAAISQHSRDRATQNDRCAGAITSISPPESRRHRRPPRSENTGAHARRWNPA